MQVPAPFQYEKATSVRHALTLLERYGTEARVVAGGHSLLPMMKLRMAEPEALVDINDLTELSRIGMDGDELVIGALVRHADLLASAVVGEHFPILRDAERVIADPIVRNRGTIGGSLCQADPSEDLSAAFAALRASLVIEGPSGRRTVGIRDFFTGPYETAVRHGELLAEIRLPIRSHAGAYHKVERRVGDWPIVAAGAALQLDGDGVRQAGIGVTAAGVPNFVADEAETYLAGGSMADERLVETGRIAAEHCAPTADQRGPADYKRHLVGELVTRALRTAAARSRGEVT